MSDRTAARQRLEQLPSATLGHWPTPLDRLERFGPAIGAEVWIKRDDVQGIAQAGNKVRKYELVLGQAVADGIDTLVTTGAVQSNSARAGAAAAAALGMGCVLLLSGRAPDQPTGNLLLDHLVGADVRFAGNVGWKALNAGVDEIVAELNAAGRRAVAAPVGCSSPLGALGFARAFLELDRQLTELDLQPSAIVHTTTSGGTHAGLLVGRALTDRNVRLVGIDAGALFREPSAGHLRLACEAAALLGFDLAAVLGEDDVEIVTSQLGDGYGRPTEASIEAIKLLARTEAILTDPIYSGKGLAGLVELVSTGTNGAGLDGPVVFWHTGGYHALFEPAVSAPLLA